VLRVTLSAGEWEVFSRPVVAVRAGGYQRLLRRLLQKANHSTRTLDVLPQELVRAESYAHHCPGGYEDRFLALLSAARRADRD
jgi:hypothetical protein